MGPEDERRACRSRFGATRLAAGLVLAVALGASGMLAFPASADVGSPSAPTPNTTAAGVTGVTYTVAFNATNALVTGNTITLTAPAGTFVTGGGGTTFTVRNVTTGNSFISTSPTIAPGGGSVTLQLNSSVGAGSRLSVEVTNATNPAQGTYTWAIATTTDPTPVTTPGYTITAPQTLSNLSAPAPTTTAANTAGVTYNVAFTTSSTGSLISPQTITLTAPAGTFVAGGGGTTFTVRNVTTGNSFISSSPTIAPGGGSVTLRLNNSTATAPGDRLSIEVTNATNTAQGTHTWTIATTSDPAPQTTPSYTLTAPQTISNLSAPAPSTTAAGVTGVTYNVAFTTSSSGSLISPQTITLTAPAGTFVAGGGGTTFTVRNVTTGNTFISTSPTIAPGGGSVTLRVNSSTATNPGDRLSIEITNATNPAVGTYFWNISTTSDPTPVNTPTYQTTNPNTIFNLSAPAPSTTAAGVTGVTYNVAFTTSSTGSLISPQTITIAGAPAGTFVAGGGGTTFTVRNVTTGNSFISSSPTIAPGGGSVSLRLNNSTATAPGDRLSIEITNATNPAVGTYFWSISTTSDPTPVNTPSYGIGTDTTPPDTAITGGPSGPTTDSTPTFTFISTEAGSTFQCWIDNGAPAACSSAHTTPPLAPGPHTFHVRATDPSNNTDPTAATRNFTVMSSPPPDTTPPDTTIVSGPTGSTPDPTPTFEFSSSEPGSTFQCSIDKGAFFACTSPFTTPELAPGPHTFEVRAIDPAGNVDTSPAGTFSTTAAVRLFTVQALPAPVLAKRVNVVPVKGQVFVSVPAGSARRVGASQRTVPGIKGRRFVPLSAAKQIPVGSFLDTRKGTVRLTSARDASGATQSSTFANGVFQVLQSGKAKGLTELRLKGSSFRPCTARAGRSRGAVRSAAKRRSKRTIRRLRGNGSGRFRTRGRYSAATVRGTDWTVTDRCDGTLTKVKRGTVTVRDFRRRKNVTVRSGKSYLARARR